MKQQRKNFRSEQKNLDFSITTCRVNVALLLLGFPPTPTLCPPSRTLAPPRGGIHYFILEMP